MNFWHQSPFVRILLPFVLGIVFESQARLHLPILPWVVPIGFVAFFVYNLLYAKKQHFRNRHLSGISAYVLLFLFGMMLAQLRVEKYHDTHFSHTLNNDHTWVMRIQGEPVEKDRSIKAVVKVIATEDHSELKPTTGTMIVYLEKDSRSRSLIAGDRIVSQEAPSDIEPPTNPGQFNYKRYLYHQFIYQQVYLPSEKWKTLPRDGEAPFLSTFEDLRKNLLVKLRDKGIEGEEYAVLSALVLGKKDYLSHDTHTAYASAGAMHVLAVSGLHVGLIYIVLLYLTGPLKKTSLTRKIQLFLLLGGIWLYALTTGMSPSVMRASVMFSFIAIAKVSQLRSNIYNTLAASALALLIYNPFMIIEVGFQLSYLAVLGIVFLQPKIYSWLSPKNKLLDKAWQLTAVSIAAQLATFPLGLLYFHQFPNYFFVSNLLVIPAATLLLYATLLFFLISWVPVVSTVFANLLNLLTYLLNQIIHQLEFLPHPLSHHISINVLETWLIYALMISGIITLIYRKAKPAFVHLAIWIVLFSMQIFENHRNLQQKAIVVHDASGKTAISLVEGRRCKFLYTEGLASDDEAMLFHVHNFWDSRDVTEIEYDSVDSLRIVKSIEPENHLFQWHGKRLLFLNRGLEEISFNRQLKIDYAFVADYYLDDLASLSKSFEIDTLIFTGYHSAPAREKLISQAHGLGIEIWDVSEKGALVSFY
ncbi:ComEC/Rec2 family competence protein [Halocola ammonii]